MVVGRREGCRDRRNAVQVEMREADVGIMVGEVGVGTAVVVGWRSEFASLRNPAWPDRATDEPIYWRGRKAIRRGRMW